MAKTKKHLALDLQQRFNLVKGDCLEFLKALPSDTAQLIISSPPYCMGREYEGSTNPIDFVIQHQTLAPELFRVLRPGGSLCWQVGNHVDAGRMLPLDYLVLQAFSEIPELFLRNRIVWTFGHGLHCRTRFSGRYETILWFTKGDDYRFNLDSVRVKQKYPGKRGYKGVRRGVFTGNPLGKNPGDVWEIPNVKGNHVEKTSHPCQFPIELVQRCIRAFTLPEDIVVDPFIGTGTTACAAAIEGRRCFGSELKARYHRLALLRLDLALRGNLRYRPVERPLYQPDPHSAVARDPFPSSNDNPSPSKDQTPSEPGATTKERAA